MRLLILFATREGHTHHVAEHVAQRVIEAGATADVVSATNMDLDLTPYDAAILAASVHLGRHNAQMKRFVIRHRAALERIPTAFLSVSLTEATAEDTHATAAARDEARATVDQLIEDFFEATGWRPTEAQPVAGALLYTRYGWLVRLIMKRIAAQAGGPTDVHHDYVLTDWSLLDLFVGTFLATQVLRAPGPPAETALPTPGPAVTTA